MPTIENNSERLARSLENHPKTSPPTARQLGFYLLAALCLLFARAPRLLLQGRVFAEEGTTYLRYAWDATALRAFLAPHQGYYSLLNNTVTLIAARLLPLSTAALFFSWTAAVIHLLLLLLAVECEIFRNTRERWLAMLALIFVTPNFEVWLTLEDCQFVLAVCAAIVLVSSTRRLFALRVGTLALAGMSGLTTVPLVPLFWLRAWHERTHRTLVYALVSTLPACLQSGLVLHALHSGDRPAGVHALRELAAYVTSRVIVLPFTTGRGTQHYDRFLFEHDSFGWTLLLELAFCAALVSGFLLFRRATRAALVLYAAAIFSAAFSWYGCPFCTYSLLAASSGAEGRYFFATNAMLLLAWLLAATRIHQRWLARTAAIVFAWLMVAGLFHYQRMRFYLVDYPAWQPQTRRWQTDEQQPILVAPATWRGSPLYLTHRHSERSDLPANAYDSPLRR